MHERDLSLAVGIDFDALDRQRQARIDAQDQRLERRFAHRRSRNEERTLRDLWETLFAEDGA